MTQITRRTILAAATAGVAAAVLPMARAQANYPDRPITLIHGFGAGGNADVVSRLVAERLQSQLGQPVIVDIRSGAGGAIASAAVAKSRPDGYTLVMLTGAHTVSAAIGKPQPYDPVKSFSFISTVSSFPFVIAVRAENPARTLSELLATAQKQPEHVTFTSVGVGSTQHMVGELLATTAGVKLLHVPYRGGGAPIQAVIGGDVDVLADTITVASPHLKSGRLRALAVTSAATWPGLPNVPPISVTLPGFEVVSWLGLAAPAGTPPDVVHRLNTEILRALRSVEVQTTLAALGSQALADNPQQMQKMVEAEIVRWRALIDKAGIVV